MKKHEKAMATWPDWKKEYKITHNASESTETAGSILVYRLCEKCNREFIVRDGIELAEKPTGLSHNITFESCPHCGKQNHMWIRLARK